MHHSRDSLSWPCRTDSDDAASRSDPVCVIESLSETMTAMSLAVRWMKISAASRDNKAIDRITLT
jgi:hypothetical protein